MEVGPLIGRSSIKTSAMVSSSCRMNTMHSWNSAGELVYPVAKDVRHSIPSEVRNAVISLLPSFILQAGLDFLVNLFVSSKDLSMVTGLCEVSNALSTVGVHGMWLMGLHMSQYVRQIW